MTDTERQRLAEIDRVLSAESPELARILAGAGGSGGFRAGRWGWAGAGALAVGLLLLGLAAALGLVALAVFALCPPLTFLVLLLGNRSRRWRHRAA
jgi:Protein of unknown function (DUF3040)